jgi:PAS domain S-box-containing protein
MAKVPKKYFERLVDNSLDIVVATDTRGRVIFYNEGATKSLGHSRAKIIGRHVATLYPSIEEARKVMWAMRSDPQGRIVNFETTFVLQSGKHIPVAITGSIIYSDAHEEIGTIGFAKDIREIRRKDQLATLGEIAVGLSHEINNPLTVILNNLELVQSSLKNDPERGTEVEQLDAIRRAVERIRERIDRIEAMARSGVYASKEYLRGSQMIDLAARGAANKHTSTEEPAPQMAGLAILVVDDDAGVTRSLEEILGREGCRVSTACSAEEALEMVKNRHLDLVLSDVVMPKMDGYDLFTQVKSISPGTAVILMTAYYYDKDHIIKRSLMEGLEGSVFKKPVNPDHLKKVIMKACRHVL